MSLSLIASYNAIGSSSPANQPSVALYAGTATTANAAGNFNALFGSNQGTCLIVALSYLYPGHTTFTFNNYAIGTGSGWAAAAGMQVVMGSDTNPNRLCLWFASIYGSGDQVFAQNGSGITPIQSVGNYQAAPQNSIGVQVGSIVSDAQLTETMTALTLTASGITYPFIGVDPA
jgi:hypothetical protein